MEKTDELIQVSPIEALTLCQNKLGGIPCSVKDLQSIGLPVMEVINALEQIKQALTAAQKVKEESDVQNTPE